MRKTWAWCGVLTLLALFSVATPAAGAEHRFGGGIHYWRTLDDLEDDFQLEDDGTAYVLSYQILPAGIFRFEGALEYFPEEFGGAEQEVFSPQVYVLVGHGLYAGLGTGVLYSSDLEDDVSDPFYAVRAGFELTLIPRVHFDINANYRAEAWSELEDADVETLTLGAQVRFKIGGSR